MPARTAPLLLEQDPYFRLRRLLQGTSHMNIVMRSLGWIYSDSQNMNILE